MIEMRTFGGNSGYVGYSMSKRAAQARNDGKFPKSDFKKEYGVTASHFELLVDAGIVYVSEWHHTSKYGNRTDFYKWLEDEFADVYQAEKKAVAGLVKQVGKAPRMQDYKLEEMSVFCAEYDAYEERRRQIVEQVKELFDNED